MSELLELSWRTQVVLVGGYLAYVTAYSGRRSGHGPTDVLGIILCFGGVGIIAMLFLETAAAKEQDVQLGGDHGNYYLGLLGVVSPVVAAIVWRGFLDNATHKVIRFLTQSDEDGLPSAWATITQLKGFSYSQLVVTLDSGVTYESYPLGSFNSYPNGPCVLGSDGSVGMYVTYITDADGQGRAINTLHDADGMRMTFIPTDQIAEIDLRRQPSKPKGITFFRPNRRS